MRDETVELRDQLRARFELLEENIRNVLPEVNRLTQFPSRDRTLVDLLNSDPKKKVQ